MDPSASATARWAGSGAMALTGRPVPDAEPYTMVIAWKPGNPSPWVARYVEAAKRWAAEQPILEQPWTVGGCDELA